MSRYDKIAGKLVQAQGTTIWGFGKSPIGDVELGVDIYRGFVQVGLGGEWWSGKMAPHMVFHHRKESGDPAYRPVEVTLRQDGHNMVFIVTGGFLGTDAAYLTMSLK
jgi:hypothetical protein